MIRNYILGVTETITLREIPEADGSNQYLSLDGVLKNGFNTLSLFTDAGGSAAVPGAAYSETTVDTEWTADESGTGGTGETVYSQFIVSDPTYQGIPLYATVKNYGTYTDNDAAYNQIAGSSTIDATGTWTPSLGYINEFLTIDTSLGNVTVTLADGEFLGQKLVLMCDGSGLTYIKGTGVYVDAAGIGVPISDGKRIVYTWDGIGWGCEDVVCADYVSGTNRLEFLSNGDYTISGNVSVGGLTSIVVVYPVAFLSASFPIFSYISYGGNFITGMYMVTSGTTTAQHQWASNSVATAATFYSYITKGKY